MALVSVTVADYANSDPAVVRSGRVKKAVANAVQQEVKSLCGLEASQVPAVEALSGAGEPCDVDSSEEVEAQEGSIHERTVSRKKKSKRHRGMGLAVFCIVSPDCGDNLRLSLSQ